MILVEWWITMLSCEGWSTRISIACLVDSCWVNLGVRFNINDELLMNISNSVLIITFGMELVCLSLEISKEFVASTKVLGMLKASNLSMIEFAWTVV